MAISGLVMSLGPTIDMVWVGKLGAASIAGVGVSGTAVMVINSLRMGIYTGVRAMVARFIGAGDRQGANLVTQQAFVFAVGFSIFTAIIGQFFSEPILRMLGLAPDVLTQGVTYMRIQFVGGITMALWGVAEAGMQASGDAKTPMIISLGARFFHMALCPFLIFGWWFFPRMAVSGAATTSIISQGLAGGIGLWFLFTGRTNLKITMKNFHFDWNMLWRMIKISIPSGINSMERSFADFLLVWFIAPFGTVAVAAHSLAGRMEGFIHMPSSGLGSAAGVLAGQNLGAQQPGRAEKTGWLAAGWFTATMVISSLAIWFWAEPFVRIFNNEPALVGLTGTFLRINIVSYMLFGLVMVLMSCLNGVGDTMTTLLTTMVTMWGVVLPLAYFLPRVTDLGVYGIRWGIVSGTIVRAVVFAIYFKTGRWKQKKV
jgi:putative MATE family efflux protein